MPAFSALVDNFNDNVIGPEWGNSYGAVSEVSGRARAQCAAGTYAGFQTAKAYTLAGSSVYLQVPVAAAVNGASVEAQTAIVITPDPLAGTNLAFNINTVTGTIRCESNVGYTDGAAVSLTYDPVAHRWLRIRETGGSLFWDTSPDGSTWTNRRTLTTPAWVASAVNSLALDLFSYRDSGTANYSEFDNVNTMSNGATFVGTGTGSAQSAATAIGARTATGTAAGAATVDAAAVGLTVHVATASGSAQSDAGVVSATNEIPEVAALAAGDWDLHIEQGSTFVQTYTVTDDPGFTWAGWGARAQIRSAASPSGQLFLDLTPYLTVDGPSIRLAIPAEQTTALTHDGRWDLEVVLGVTVVRLLQGAVKVSLEVTR
ncbi:hypothetical protein [Streptomyces sp. CC224B]|uniref:hypothetical protein n=1 Tax=Streptomyces sp. CC224B TaxID=3044571 RepID=UPI0024A7C966|nr:hypothetical protein [Streptomyces sp. CC224B]